MSRKASPRPVNGTPTVGAPDDSTSASPTSTLAPGRHAARNPYLDALRGFAIVLMIVDHVAAVWMDTAIVLGGLRFWTRPAMPLFCVVMGFCLKPDGTFNLKRWVQIAAAAAATNLLITPLYGVGDILVSLLVAAAACTTVGRWTLVLPGLILLYRFDPTAAWLDYQLTLAIPMTALGGIARRYGPSPTMAAAAGMLAITMTGRLIEPDDTYRYVVWFAPVAVAALFMVDAAWRSGAAADQLEGDQRQADQEAANPSDADRRESDPLESDSRAADRRESDLRAADQRSSRGPLLLRPLIIAGRHPLTIYVVHLYIIVGPVAFWRIA